MSLRWVATSLCLGLCLITSGQPGPAAATAPPDDHPRTSVAIEHAVLTDGPETYRYAGGPPDKVRIRSRTGVAPQGDWNRREIFTKSGARASRNQVVCATWSKASAPSAQEGLAVHVRKGQGGRRVRAITLTKNTIYGVDWFFNVLTWDTTRSGDPWRAVAQFDMSDVLVRDHQLLPLPWRVCLQVHGVKVQFKVWLPDREPEPSWADPVHVRTAQVPHRFGHAGVPGWYAGHVPPGATLVYRDLTARASHH